MSSRSSQSALCGCSKTARAAATTVLVSLTLASATVAIAQERFKSPEDAVAALVSAVRAGKARDIAQVLGPSGREITLSGDKVAGRKARAAFLLAFGVRHQIVKAGNMAELQVGLQDWTLPIPIVASDGTWRFDADRGREEILHRRIGRNESNAVQVILAYVDAQNDYAEANPQRSRVPGYAQRVASSPNKKDGLYWPAVANEPRSPLGEAMAIATLEREGSGREPRPYHGYYYKILTRQGPSAPGGAADYIVDGNMIGGFALLAHPAEYGISGIKTFLVNHEGTVFQKDLGAETMSLASRMTLFDPDHTWTNVGPRDLAHSQR
ncbi:DUF2950 domain-containing protein [Bradyrhizobium sp. LHD-71]|uniref:DUF2950 domain-containing protein n=1 Tax=Bradyrhizobium sp. LHD-71 TaxID=3072141 RepID=UPI00280E2120|nr:DUF2950 domain-containing protein [Bradyrhizobium sp. LHD-71]MDQ8730195.1 DUF2950 domain-containing protein [Bradyrhizobium sp. LHD-71]